MVLYTPPSIKGASSPEQIALAEHLAKKGAKFYGAYWCSFCRRQREMFGAGGVRALPYVECARDGFQGQQCPPQVTGYPAWEIGGKFYGGMRTLQDLQTLSGFDPSVKFPEYVPPPPAPRPPPPPGGYKPPPVEQASTPYAIALAEHLKRTGASFYGAYWCKYCGLQRAAFGKEGVKALPYVECAADGYQSAADKCKAKPELRAYPTWEINGKFYSGLQSVEELSSLSGFGSAGSASTSPTGKSNSLGLDLTGPAPVLRNGDDCDLADGAAADCK